MTADPVKAIWRCCRTNVPASAAVVGIIPQWSAVSASAVGRAVNAPVRALPVNASAGLILTRRGAADETSASAAKTIGVAAALPTRGEAL